MVIFSMQSALGISNTDISKYPLISWNIVWTVFLFVFNISMPVVSNTEISKLIFRKFIFRYQLFGLQLINDFEISPTDCLPYLSGYKTGFPLFENDYK